MEAHMRAMPYLVKLAFTTDDGENGFMTSDSFMAGNKQEALQKALDLHEDVTETLAGSYVYELVMAL
jgi:hypothetical protein